MSVAGLALIFFPVILIFGMDAPNTPILKYLLWLSMPAVAVAIMSAACWGVHRLWYSRYLKLPAFMAACGLGGIGYWLAIHLRPH